VQRWHRLATGQASARQVAAVGLLGTLTIALVDLALGGRLSMFFDLGFITLCLGLGLLPRRESSYVVAFAPPLVLMASFALIGVVDAGVVGHPDDGMVQSVITGLTNHAAPLAIGYALCLGALGLRQRSLVGATRTG
jgi:hypothetical protein